MLPQQHICPIPLAIMASELSSCHWKFQGLPEFTVSFADKFQLDPTFKATTLPGLGLIDKIYETDHPNALNDAWKVDRKPWENFKTYVEHLNKQNPTNTKYKVLYITRHGLGYHNVFEAQVGKKAWDVSSYALRGISL
jgi:hypothetical protein